MKVLIFNGVEIAARGEFSKRAFINGKMDLLKAESIKTLIESQNEQEHASAVSFYNGLNKKLQEWQEQLQQELSLCEAEIEFGEEELLKPQLNEMVLQIKKAIQAELLRIKKFREIKNGINVVLAGPVNAGKSSLFNYLLGYKRAIVHEQPGTTRDSIAGKIEVDGKEINLFDTAGIRSTTDSIENEGIQISRELISSAQLIVWITDVSGDISQEEIKIIESLNTSKTIVVFNKIDKAANFNKINQITQILSEYVEISIKSQVNLQNMSDLLKNKINDLYSRTPAPDIFLNERHEKIASKILSSLNLVIRNWKQKEISAFYLRQTLTYFEELFGKIDNDKILNNIFDTFCIGK